MMKDFVGFLIVLLIGVAAVVTPIAIIDNHSRHVHCLRIHEMTGLETKIVGKLSPSCYIKVGSSWVTKENWVVNDNQ